MLRDEPLEPLQPAAMKDSDALSDVETAIDGDEWLPEPSVARPPVTQATATRNIDAAVAEWWSINDKEEFKSTLQDLETNIYNVQVLKTLLNSVTDRRIDDFKKTANLVHYLLEENVFTIENIVESLEMYVADVEDNALDAPNLYKYLGILLGNLILKGVLRMQSISHMIEPLLSSRSRMPPASKLLGELLSAIRTEGGDAALLGVIQAEPVMYELYWPNGAFNDATLAEWIAKYNLAVLSQAMDQAVPMDLETKFKVLKGDAKEVSKWIETNVNETERKTPEFVFGLTKLCLEFMVSKTFTDGPTINTHSGPVIRKIKEILLGYEDLLKISVMHDSPEVTLSLKVAILQAVEAVWKNSGKSCEMMECILRILYDEDVVDKASNDKWKASISKETYRVLIGWFRFVSCD